MLTQVFIFYMVIFYKKIKPLISDFSMGLISLSISTLHLTISFGLGAATRFVSLFTKLYGNFIHTLILACKHSKIKSNSFILCDSTRVSNELGAGNPKAGRFSVCTAMILAVIETLIVTIILFGCRNVLGYAYTHDDVLVHYVAVITPFLCASIFTDSLQAVLSG